MAQPALQCLLETTTKLELDLSADPDGTWTLLSVNENAVK